MELLWIGLISFFASLTLTYAFFTALFTNDMRDLWRRDSEVPGWWRSWFRYATCRDIPNGSYIRKSR